ncbi:uncharacterized protein LOC124371604 isoform X2 [Homalodisca vitripennis]|uniref:uncharacterized protein LOC124371604 isoform X2 n=1 Tax=Homalodisca vitripennis TaxID=197043 RepID=UPI001EEA9E4F|nr:uncharacterized protein LOC124371604 isoform X2 [Homalodisca vitripennis]
MLMRTQGTALVLVLVSICWGVTSTKETDLHKVCEKYAESVYETTTDVLTGDDIKYDTCLQNIEKLITDNDETERYPHMVKIGYGNESSIHWASIGTLISERYVLTFAHNSDFKKNGSGKMGTPGRAKDGP